MIDASQCVYEDTFNNPEYNEVVHYFLYPKDMDMVELYSEEDYGNVVCMCVSLTEVEGVEYYMAISPTVEEDGCRSDVDWRDLYYGIHYNDDTVLRLLKLVPKAKSDT